MQPEMTEHAAAAIKHAAAAIKVTAVTTYSASASALIFGLNAEVFAALAGVAIAFVAMVANIALTWHFKSQHLKIAKKKSDAERMQFLADD